MTSIAIVGTGIAGLGCGYLLHRNFDIEMFDRNNYAGGHTNTIVVEEEGTPVAIDTGFMVFNEVTYPNLTRLFDRLGVNTVPTSMSFGVQHLAAGIEYCGGSIGQLFAQRRNLLRPRFLRALRQIARFNSEAHEAIASGAFDGLTLDAYVTARNYGEDFLQLYLLPMAAAVWSTPFGEARHFPAVTLLRFFDNHGLLGGLDGQLPWLTVAGGAKQYVEKMTRGFRERIHLGSGVDRVRRDPHGVTIHLTGGATRRFDRVIFACHADEALAMLEDPTPDERRLLGAFRYQRNVAELHTDAAPMPRTRRAWASWNVRIDDTRATTIYWMNSLQGVSQKRDYFVSIDDPGLIDPDRILRRIVYTHPMFTLDAITAQRELPSLNRLAAAQSTYFCGSYFRYGFHEDAFASAIDVCRTIASNDVWQEVAA